MPERSIDITVTFANPFAIGKTTGSQPAGSYRVTIDEEEISCVSALAYRRVATLFHTPALRSFGPHQVFYVDADDFDRALAADRNDAADKQDITIEQDTQ